MVDWEGNMVEPKDRVKILLSDFDEDEGMSAAAVIGSLESRAIDEHLDQINETSWDQFKIGDEYCGMDVSPIYNAQSLSARLEEKVHDSNFKMSIGATITRASRYLVDDCSDTEPESEDEDDSEIDEEDMDQLLAGNLNFDDVMANVSATHARMTRNTSPEHLSKVWQIDHETAKRTLDVTSQHCERSATEELSRNFSTNDWMLQYHRLNCSLFSDTIFTSIKSKCHNTCAQV